MATNETADIICMNCGRLLGEIAQREAGLMLVKRPGAPILRVANGRLECIRCGGRGFIEGRLLVAS